MSENINNKFCMSCVKSNVCTFYEKLSKLGTTEKKPVPLTITVNSCEEFLTTEEE